MCTCSNGYSGDGLVNCNSESLRNVLSLSTHKYLCFLCVCKLKCVSNYTGNMMCHCGFFLSDIDECTEGKLVARFLEWESHFIELMDLPPYNHMHIGATPSQSLVLACPVYPGRFWGRRNGLGLRQGCFVMAA